MWTILKDIILENQDHYNSMKNILVIEDSKIINNIIKKELTKLGFKISQAFTLKEAKENLEKKKFQLIILDLHLPDGEGSELIANIQSLTKTKVVVLTSSQDAELREELFQYGILDYIIKDKNLLYSITEIIKIIEHMQEKVQEQILIIDDSKFICKQVKTILEPRNYKVTSAYTAKTGLKKLHEKEFKLLILDMELPDLHGIDVLEFIRKDRRFLHLPILVLSGTSTPEIIRNVLKNGANDFLKKPFVFEEFILKVDLWIDYFQKEKELAQKSAELESLNENLARLVKEEVQKNRTKDKMMFAQSRQAQMGEMLAMIAHQWRQPLNAISAAVSVINLKVKNGQYDYEMSKNISSKIDRYIQHLSSTIDDFRDFFKPQKEMRITNFEVIFSKAYSLIESDLQNKKIEIDIDSESIEDFTSYENELVQVVLNILKNAEDVLLERGIKEPLIKITIQDYSISIEDNAGGIDEEYLGKVFDPYFSTKKKNGTGLGLYMSKVIIEEHCYGTLDVKNGEKGAKFTIKLPQKVQCSVGI